MVAAGLTGQPKKPDNAERRAQAHALIDALLDEFEAHKRFGHVAIKIHVQSGAFQHVEDETKRVHK